jgi:hypothetical protein
VHSTGAALSPGRFTASLRPPLEQEKFDWIANGSPAPSTTNQDNHSMAPTNMSRHLTSPLSLWKKYGRSRKHQDANNSVYTGVEKQGWRGMLSRTQSRIRRNKQGDEQWRAGVSFNPDAFNVQSSHIVPVLHLKPTDTDFFPSLSETPEPSFHQNVEQTDFERARADSYTLMTEHGFRAAQVEKLRREIAAATRNLSKFQEYRQSWTEARFAAPPSEGHWLDGFGKDPTKLEDWGLGTFIDVEGRC